MENHPYIYVHEITIINASGKTKIAFISRDTVMVETIQIKSGLNQR